MTTSMENFLKEFDITDKDMEKITIISIGKDRNATGAMYQYRTQLQVHNTDVLVIGNLRKNKFFTEVQPHETLDKVSVFSFVKSLK